MAADDTHAYGQNTTYMYTIHVDVLKMRGNIYTFCLLHTCTCTCTLYICTYSVHITTRLVNIHVHTCTRMFVGSFYATEVYDVFIQC